ncbi:hypothetical protein GCK72_015809 [Caenorhabditis remanei]|uniref:Uncharacterized protein n=1 Tax=Caenorhabditis remanei TaxID=31234 RepID=A0A6A5GXL6_CAERE|nr:hypothetical protein GCK72_015809 [Caenorhabditis remanei]KAF1759344.1 hypothetical protein GCK72_015809 [Caenorhabditis remanei]
MLIYRTLLLFLFLIYQIKSDPVNIEVFLRCEPTVRYWCGELTVFEDDLLPSTRDILKTEKFCTPNWYQEYEYPRLRPDGDWSSDYEFNYSLQHNCTSDGSIRCYTPYFSTDILVRGEQNVTFYGKVFNRGEAKMC